jgi:selenocysteine lyase/cysteine desulfurase
LSGIGMPSGGTDLRPPRMRAFLMRHPDLAALKQTLLDKNIRAWSGQYNASSCLVRVATNVYNDRHDIDVLADTLRPVMTDR